MDILDSNVLMAIAGSVGAIGGAILTVQKIFKNINRGKAERDAKVLLEAKEAASTMRRELQVEIDELKLEFTNLKENVDKDLLHLRETYNGEIRNLGDKIEDLRTELRNQHGQLVQLLSKMIDNRD